ncbi:hypothetical protein F2Q68_00003436 [Brassica cretica]|uniref:Uncharacterized protein n=1 Tax=Brassica cretica TaxID=69181 RepID=A0A8S9JN51_BRACR|nr:hypothetical protein F2Q68_00003436 [Brassica cretica]
MNLLYCRHPRTSGHNSGLTHSKKTLDSLTTTTSEIGGTNSSATSGTQGPNDIQFLHLLRLSGDQPRDNPVEKEAPPDRQSLSHFAQVSKILPITKSRKFPNNVR